MRRQHLVVRLINALDRERITYCHWKSNYHLHTSGVEDDLDVLVDREDIPRFEAVLADLRFKQAVDRVQMYPSIAHYYGLDDESGTFVHLHVYYRVVTGDSLLKGYVLPLDRMLLQDRREIDAIPTPQPAAELVIFVVRMMVKHASLIEYMLLRRANRAGYQAARAELEWLLASAPATCAAEALAQWLPVLEGNLFMQCVEALRTDAPFLRRFLLARRLRRQISGYRRYARWQEPALRGRLVLTQLWRRLRRAGRPKQLASGGTVVAFVGPEAVGKSTLVREMTCWLGRVFDVSSTHLGKPPATWLTFLPNFAVPFLRAIAPAHRTSGAGGSAGRRSASPSLLYSIRSALDAWDRLALARRVRRQAAGGTIVICDRYPSTMVGAMDSARLQPPAGSGLRRMILAYLAQIEHDLYRQIPPPDVVIRLTVPVDIAVERNRERQKKGKETDAYVLRRHTAAVVPSFPTARTFELDSNQPEDQTVGSARNILWSAL